jgi:hypothetical protein
MLGFADAGVAAAWLLCLASTALCVGYGLWRWNADEDHTPVAGEDQP